MKVVKWIALGLVGLLVVAAIVYGFLPKPIPSEFARATRGDPLRLPRRHGFLVDGFGIVKRRRRRAV